MKRRWLTKHKYFYFNVATVVRGSLREKDSEPSSNEDLESEILAKDKLLDEKIELGKKISKVLKNTNTKEESLSKKLKEAFELYQIRKFAINPNVDLKFYPWQQ